ncbi:hypothetical protein CONLIGDRAFT_132396 [Coniochaeta ligniaria NRRL 30616]|uniref:Uncharacterized protein n=1 Tax=Coniochaeta ligniaria NRRL 30616 TaxID=1408157 RepID=A0A1J7I7P9_9PEZI|nr:hypothetical protein CONLIGDRAFT_132396 [Coniochaeta ligniaria NRRL 30616]
MSATQTPLESQGSLDCRTSKSPSLPSLAAIDLIYLVTVGGSCSRYMVGLVALAQRHSTYKFLFLPIQHPSSWPSWTRVTHGTVSSRSSKAIPKTASVLCMLYYLGRLYTNECFVLALPVCRLFFFWVVSEPSFASHWTIQASPFLLMSCHAHQFPTLTTHDLPLVLTDGSWPGLAMPPRSVLRPMISLVGRDGLLRSLALDFGRDWLEISSTSPRTTRR